MRTNVVVDDDLMKSALKVTGLKTKKAAIEEGLKLLVQVRGRKEIKGFGENSSGRAVSMR